MASGSLHLLPMKHRGLAAQLKKIIKGVRGTTYQLYDHKKRKLILEGMDLLRDDIALFDNALVLK